jgi:hypothetical protein
MSQPINEDKQNADEETLIQGDPPPPRTPSPKFGTCTVCADDFIEDDDIYFLQCLHKFHSTCISKWLTVKQQCPVCKFPANVDVVGVDDQGNFISSTGQTITNGVIENIRNTEHINTRIGRAIEVLRNIHSANRSNADIADMDWNAIQDIVQNRSRVSQDIDNIISSQTQPDSPYPEFSPLENESDTDSDSDMSEPSSLPIARPAPEIQILARQRDRLARIASRNTRQMRYNARFPNLAGNGRRTSSSHEYSSSSEEYIEESEPSVSQPATPVMSQLQDAVEFKSEPILAAESEVAARWRTDLGWSPVNQHWDSTSWMPTGEPWIAATQIPISENEPTSNRTNIAIESSNGNEATLDWSDSKWETELKTQPPSDVDLLDEYLISDPLIDPTDVDDSDSNEEQDGQYPETPLWSD